MGRTPLLSHTVVRWGWELAKTCPPGWPPSHPLLPWPVSEAIVLGTLPDDPRLKTMPGGEGCLMLSGFQLGSEVSGCGPDTLTQSLHSADNSDNAGTAAPAFSPTLACVPRLARAGRGEPPWKWSFHLSAAQSSAHIILPGIHHHPNSKLFRLQLLHDTLSYNSR